MIRWWTFNLSHYSFVCCLRSALWVSSVLGMQEVHELATAARWRWTRRRSLRHIPSAGAPRLWGNWFLYACPSSRTEIVAHGVVKAEHGQTGFYFPCAGGHNHLSPYYIILQVVDDGLTHPDAIILRGFHGLLVAGSQHYARPKGHDDTCQDAPNLTCLHILLLRFVHLRYKVTKYRGHTNTLYPDNWSLPI